MIVDIGKVLALDAERERLCADEDDLEAPEKLTDLEHLILAEVPALCDEVKQLRAAARALLHVTAIPDDSKEKQALRDDLGSEATQALTQTAVEIAVHAAAADTMHRLIRRALDDENAGGSDG